MTELYMPDATQWIGAFEAGERARMAGEKRQAQQSYGKRLMSSDYKGAASAIAGYDPEQALSTLQYGQKADDSARLSAVNDALLQGNYAAAVKAAGGHPEAMKLIGTHMAETVDLLATKAQSLKGKSLDEARQIYKTKIIPDMVRRGYAASEFEDWDPTPENIVSLESEALGLKESMGLHAPKVVGNALVTPEGKEIYRADKYMLVPRDTDLVAIGGGGEPSADGARPDPAQAQPASGPLDPHQFFKDFVLKHEGGLNPADMNGAPTNFGINQRAHPEVDVTKLTPEQAADIFTKDYYLASGADKLPPALAAIHSDTAFINPSKAQQFLKASGGDPAKYLELRKQWMAGMVANNPAAKKYEKAWAKRNDDLAAFASSAGNPPPNPPGAEAERMPSGARVVHRGQPKAGYRPASAEEKAAYGVGADVPAKINEATGELTVVTGTGAGLKRVPAQIQKGYLENGASISQIDQAIALLQQNPHAMGLKNVVGDETVQRVDRPGWKDGITTRAAVANVGAVKIHDLSGAAVTAAETPRLKPFIPMPTDTAEAAIQKLQQLKQQIENNNAQIEVQYGEESGYTPMAASAHPASGSALPPQAAAQLKDGHNTTFANGQTWTLRGGKPVRVK